MVGTIVSTRRLPLPVSEGVFEVKINMFRRFEQTSQAENIAFGKASRPGKVPDSFFFK